MGGWPKMCWLFCVLLEQLQSLFKWTSEPVWVGSVGGELGGATGKEVSAPKRAER